MKGKTKRYIELSSPNGSVHFIIMTCINFNTKERGTMLKLLVSQISPYMFLKKRLTHNISRTDFNSEKQIT